LENLNRATVGTLRLQVGPKVLLQSSEPVQDYGYTRAAKLVSFTLIEHPTEELDGVRMLSFRSRAVRFTELLQPRGLLGDSTRIATNDENQYCYGIPTQFDLLWIARINRKPP
jgi:hypothetical protein